MSSLRKKFVNFILKTAKTKEKSENMQQAVFWYKLAYWVLKNEHDLLLKISGLQIKLNKHKKAIKYLELYLKKYPESLKALLLLGISKRESGKIEEAIAVHKQCLENNEKVPWVTYSLGLDYEKQENTDMAIKYYDETLRIDKSFSKAYFRLGYIYMKEEKWNLALNMFLDGLSLDEQNAMAWVNLAFCYMKVENFEAGEKVLKEVKKKNMDTIEIKLALGICYINKEMYEKALNLTNSLNKEKDADVIMTIKLKIAEKKGQYEKIEELLSKNNMKKNNEEYWYYKAIVEANTNREEKAVESLRKAIKIDETLRKEAKTDPNFKRLREIPAFKILVY